MSKGVISLRRKTIIVFALIIISFVDLFIVLFSDISIPVVERVTFYSTRERAYGMLFLTIFTFLSTDIIGLYAFSEKNYKKATALSFISIWTFMLTVQYFRVIFHEGLFEGLIQSITIWTIVIGIIWIPFDYIFSKKEIKRSNLEQQKSLEKRVTKSGNYFLVKIGDETIKVSKNELYNENHPKT